MGVSLACALAGIVAGVVTLTSLGSTLIDIIVPIAQHKAGFLDKAYELHNKLKTRYSAKIDASEFFTISTIPAASPSLTKARIFSCISPFIFIIKKYYS